VRGKGGSGIVRKVLGAASIAITLSLLAWCSATSSSSSTSTSSSTASTFTPVWIGALAYTAAVCDAMTTWDRSIEDGGKTLRADIHNAGSLDDMKAAVVTYLDQVIAASKQEADTVAALTAPGISGGRDAHAAIVAGLRTEIATYEAARARVDALGPADGDLTTAVLEVMKDLRTSLRKSSISLTDFDDPVMSRAFEAEPTCAAFL
jgi:hypothetical protein